MDVPACSFMSYQGSCRPHSLCYFQLLSPLWHFIASVLLISGSNSSSLIQDRISFRSQKMAKTLPPEQNEYATEAALENSSLLMFLSAQSLLPFSRRPATPNLLYPIFTPLPFGEPKRILPGATGSSTG